MKSASFLYNFSSMIAIAWVTSYMWFIPDNRNAFFNVQLPSVVAYKTLPTNALLVSNSFEISSPVHFFLDKGDLVGGFATYQVPLQLEIQQSLVISTLPAAGGHREKSLTFNRTLMFNYHVLRQSSQNGLHILTSYSEFT